MAESPVEDAQLDVEDHRFAVVPEWMIDTPVSDSAFRLYVVLLRYGATSGCRMPSRRTLARRLHKRSVDSVDRALRELVAAGAVVVERRRDGTRNLTNRYYVRTSGPGRADAATPGETPSVAGAARAGSRSTAATPGRKVAASLAADLRPDREPPTENPTPPTPDEALAARCQEARAALGLPTTRWGQAGIAAARQRCTERGWPLVAFESAMLAVARDSASHSPVRVAEAGGWWDEVAPAGRTAPAEDLTSLEAALDALDGLRPKLQALARQQLAAEGEPATRATVMRRALALHDAPAPGASVPTTDRPLPDPPAKQRPTGPDQPSVGVRPAATTSAWEVVNDLSHSSDSSSPSAVRDCTFPAMHRGGRE